MNKLDKSINNANWEEDCGCKCDLDFPLIYCSSRAYLLGEDSSCYVGFYYGQHEEILEDELFANNEDELKVKVRTWYKENYIKALKIILEESEKE